MLLVMIRRLGMDNILRYKKITNFVICLSVIGLALAFVGTYSYFSKSNSYNVTGNVINWSFSANNSSSSFTQSLSDIIPGDSGSFVVTLDASGSTDDVECSIVPVFSGELSGMALYSDEQHTTKIEEKLVQNVAAGSTASTTIYWVWEYDTGLLSGQSISFTINVIGRQVVS